LIEREQLHPTFLVDQICVPHARLPWLDRFLLGLVVPQKPFAHSVAGEPEVKAMFMILAPQNKNAMMLQTLAAIARLLKSRDLRLALTKTTSSSRLIRQIEETGIDVKKTLVAADVMVPITHKVTINTILAHAVDVLVDAEDEGLPVLTEQGRLVGELTSREVLAVGMPKYVDLLANPVMLENFEPFENFFQHENSLKVRELCRRDIITVPPTAPIVQVTHLMMTKQKRRIYVVEDGTLLGVILRKNIIAKVLHF
jgi:nitrogen PTS system EIIA component